MSNVVTRATGVAGSYSYTLDITPTAPPQVTVYSDPARTTVVVAATATSATGNPVQFTAAVPTALAAGHYYLRFVSTFTGGQTFTDDGNDLVLQAPVGSVGPAIATTGHRVPYVSAAEFLAYPEFLDLNDLITGGAAAAQTDELTNMLLRATEAMDGFCHQPIGAAAHTVTRDVRVRADGCVWVKPPRRPFVPGSVSAVSFTFPGDRTVYTLEPAGVDYVDGKLSISLFGSTSGVPMPARVGSKIRVTVAYAAGYPIGAFTAAVAASDTQFAISDPTGIVAGQVLRVYDPPSATASGSEEYVTVSSGYVPGIATIPVTSAMKAHASGVQVDALPQDAKLACVLWTMGLLMRPTSGGGGDDPFADAPDAPTTTDRTSSRRSGRGLIKEARQLLRDGGYVRVMP